MAKMSQYCKAYPLSRVREFAAWKEKTPIEETSDGTQKYIYLHNNFVVTAGVFVDEDVLFDSVTPGWIEFCTLNLAFSVPPDIAAMRTPTTENDEVLQSDNRE